MSIFGESSFRERMQRYILDMAVNVAVSTHKDLLRETETDRKLVHEIASLAVQIALEKYDVENRTIVAQAESFERMAAERNATGIPMRFLAPK